MTTANKLKVNAFTIKAQNSLGLLGEPRQTVEAILPV
jgi:hypothetical protein